MHKAFHGGVKKLVIIGLASFAVACSTAPKQEHPTANKTAQVAPATAQPTNKVNEKQKLEQKLPNVELTQELLYKLLLAEIAGYRGDLGIAIQNYLAAAKQTRDPRMAERAVRIALYAQDIKSAMIAARLWVDVSPEDVNAHLLLGILNLRQNDLQAATTQLGRTLSLQYRFSL